METHVSENVFYTPLSFCLKQEPKIRETFERQSTTDASDLQLLKNRKKNRAIFTACQEYCMGLVSLLGLAVLVSQSFYWPANTS